MKGENIMKKILCFTLSFVLLISNAQVFAQNAEVQRVISTQEMNKILDDITKMRKELETFNRNFIEVLDRSETNVQNYFKGIQFIDEEANKLSKAYASVLDRSYSYASYISVEKGKTALERLTYQYIGAPELLVRNHHLDESILLNKITGTVENLGNAWINQTALEELIKTAQKDEPMIKDLITALDKRLISLREVIVQSIHTNNEIYEDTIREVIRKYITQKDVLYTAMRTIPEEELRVIGLIAEYNARKASDLKITWNMWRYLKKMGMKNRPSIFRIFKNVATDNWVLKKFDPFLSENYKYKKVIEDFPILQNGKYVPSKYTIRKVLRLTPLVIIGVVLTAGAITEIHSDNSFAQGTLGARKMKELKNKIASGEASFTEAMVYYSDERSTSVVNNDPEHLINAINLSLAVVQADKDFDRIAQIVQNEVGNEYGALSKEEVQNSFNMSYDKAIQQVSENMI